MIPIDLAEVFGAALVDGFRRGLAFLGCLLLASLLCGLSLVVGQAVVRLDFVPLPGGTDRWLLM